MHNEWRVYNKKHSNNEKDNYTVSLYGGGIDIAVIKKPDGCRHCALQLRL